MSKDECEQLSKFSIGEECTYTDPSVYMSGPKQLFVIIEEIRKFKNEFKYVIRNKETKEIIKVWFSEKYLSKPNSNSDK